ncbi:glutamine amidotransferase [Sphingomonas abietis]|uniref:Glutamine amidotransferase n=1 Tax=Sphingomonas abietis TaxID=3012344 RepID=A0ABY7NN95_9SPHN|nr:glutamine amidotransferase [Sphingomonas abietis]WBO22057.1 glutamine amidotransferase [Sphingomonas abietis]
MRALVVHHVAHEGLAAFGAPLAARGYAIDRVFAGDRGFAEIDFLDPDLLILMGGPMAVYERDAHPWIEGELARIAMRIMAGGPTLGICLGAQLIAAALGGEVKPGPVREVGFAPVSIGEAGRHSPLAALAGVPILHWHGDGFTVPAGATLLAETEYFPQAFALGATVLALQCHPEMGDMNDGIGRWIEEDADYILGAGTSADVIRADHARLGADAARAGRRLLVDWLAGLP